MPRKNESREPEEKEKRLCLAFLPPIATMDKEVIVLTDSVHGKIIPDSHCICYGHIVDKNFAVDHNGCAAPRFQSSY